VLILALLASLNIGVQPQLVAALPRVPLPRPSPTAVRATVHGNRLASGALRGRTLTLALDVVESAWHPESTDEPEVPIFAKDGADLPPVLATDRPAHVEMGPGETADFEFTPTAAGEWRIEVNSVETGWYIPLPVIVTARPR
jgi:hypothetical protein